MKQQKGCVSIDRQNWVCRWRETVPDGKGGTVRKLRFKVLGEVTAEHRRNKDRKTGKLRVPSDIQDIADDITRTANASPISVLSTIGEFVEGTYLPKKNTDLKNGSYDAIEWRWNRYLKERIGARVLRDYERKDAAQLWRDIQKAFPQLGSQSLRHIRFTVSGIFETAKDEGLYKGENPASASLPANLRGKGETRAYTVDEVARMLSLFIANPLAQAIIALAFGSGLRKGELAGLEWTDYQPADNGATIRVRRSVWKGTINTPKTDSSADDTFIDAEICGYLEAWREYCGGVTKGPVFPGKRNRKTGLQMPINLDSFCRFSIRPLLDRCAVCRKHKRIHRKEDHKFQRDESMPAWHGYHAFRRGAATFAAKKLTGNGTAAASSLLRHSDTGVTEDCYIKETKQERRVRNAQKVVSTQQQRQQAAGAIGAGLKAVSVN